MKSSWLAKFFLGICHWQFKIHVVWSKILHVVVQMPIAYDLYGHFETWLACKHTKVPCTPQNSYKKLENNIPMLLSQTLDDSSMKMRACDMRHFSCGSFPCKECRRTVSTLNSTKDFCRFIELRFFFPQVSDCDCELSIQVVDVKIMRCWD